MIWLKESSIPVDRPELLKLGVAVHALKLNQGIFAIEVNLVWERPIQHYTIADNGTAFCCAVCDSKCRNVKPIKDTKLRTYSKDHL